MIFFINQSHANIAHDPFVRQNTDRRNFEPGGQYHLFGTGRGVISNQQGDINILPTYQLEIGNLNLENALINGKISYDLVFSDHSHDEHAPFDNKNSASKEDSQGQAFIGFTSYNLNWQGYELHPADAYDGAQGSGYPAPTGARDEYTYDIKGQATSVNVNFDDSRSTKERFSDRFSDATSNLSEVSNNWDTLTKTDSSLNTAGNFAQGVGAAAKGFANIKDAVGAVIGVNDAIQGVGLARDIAIMEAMRAMPPSSHYEAVTNMAAADNLINSANASYENLANSHPNTAAFLQAGGEIINATNTGKGRTNQSHKPKLCSFHGDMNVSTVQGYKPIKQISVGDWVLSKHEATGEINYRQVLDQYNNHYSQSVYITIADNTGNIQTIISNTIHPFFIKTQDGSTPPTSSEGRHYEGDIKDGYWVDASNLKAGYQLLSENNTWQTVKQVLLTDEPLSAYNLTVDHNHTYFVAGTPNGKYQAFGVWVHNDCLRNHLNGYRGQKISYGSNIITINKSGLKHILERHHPDYWNKTTKDRQTFFNEKMTIAEVESAVKSVLSQNAVDLRNGKKDGQIEGEFNGQRYVLGLRDGVVGQFYPKDSQK